MADRILETVVVGGSLTGLMHGIILKRLGHNVSMLERSESVDLIGQGAGISAQEHVQGFLAKYDRSPQPLCIDCPKVQFLDKEAKVTKTWDVPLKMTSWRVLYHRLRANFDGLSSDFCHIDETSQADEGRVAYAFDSTVTGVEERTNKVAVYVQNSSGVQREILADLVIAADGPSSKIRQILTPNFQRTYAGYVAWRGMVLESEVSESDRTLFAHRCTLFRKGYGHILLYNIPGERGTLEPGQRMLNFVWYCNYLENSQELRDLMTDVDGNQHRNTVLAGKVQPHLWEKQKAYAASVLPAPFVNVISKVSQPFVQRITDMEQASKASFFGGKLFIAGDALSQFRPHIASSTNQAALHALLLEKYLLGEISAEEREVQCLDYATATSTKSVAWGTINQHGKFASFVAIAICVQALAMIWVRTKLRGLFGSKRSIEVKAKAQ